MSNSLTLTKQHARRFLLAHHGLWPPRRKKGTRGILDFIRHVNCIQYDPINVVGQNPHLVLQSRVQNYKPHLLEKLLYEERSLVDGWDKVMSIYPLKDWPYFARHREKLPQYFYENENAREAVKLLEWVLEELEQRGALSSLDLKNETKIDWWWGNTAKAARVALDTLFYEGRVLVHHRVGTRRYFDLTQRLVPEEILQHENPHSSKQDYQDWHVLRRVGSLGLAHPGAGEHWGGMLGMKSPERKAALARLVERGELVAATVEGLDGQSFYLRKSDLPVLEKVGGGRQPNRGAAFLAALDNLMWDRKLISMLFGFDYMWEVYKPAKQRRYGYYVLPVIYGDQFVGRFDPTFDRESGTLTIQSWWWEEDVDPQESALQRALGAALSAFTDYLDAENVRLGTAAAKDAALKRIIQ